MNNIRNNVVFGFIVILVGIIIASCTTKKKDVTALVDFVEAGDLLSAQKCLDAGADINGFRKEGWSGHKHDGETALAVAINSKSLKAVQWAIANGADVNMKSNGDCYPIATAAMKGDLEIAQELEKAGANFDVTYLNIKLSDWAERSGNSKEFIDYIRRKETSKEKGAHSGEGQ